MATLIYNAIDIILGYCGFDNAIYRQAVAEDGFSSFQDIGGPWRQVVSRTR
jgi:hypothetical protein